MAMPHVLWQFAPTEQNTEQIPEQKPLKLRSPSRFWQNPTEQNTEQATEQTTATGSAYERICAHISACERI